MIDRRSALRDLCLAVVAVLGLAAAGHAGSASETKLQRYVVGVSGMT
jgi:hypothetical protein